MNETNKHQTTRHGAFRGLVRTHLTLAIALGAVACASQAHQVQEAEVDAVEKGADQQVAAIDERGEARNDSIEQSAEAQEDAIESGGETPRSELNEERVELNEDQRTFVSNSKTKVSKLEVRVNEAERKLQLTNANSQDMKAEIGAARTQIASLNNDLQTLTTVQPERWDATRADVENRLDGLSERVDMLMDKADD